MRLVLVVVSLKGVLEAWEYLGNITTNVLGITVISKYYIYGYFQIIIYMYMLWDKTPPAAYAWRFLSIIKNVWRFLSIIKNVRLKFITFFQS